jgi:uncharacterized repeat protein (TIGR03806 family)
VTRRAAALALAVIGAAAAATAGCARERGFARCAPPDLADLDLATALDKYPTLSALCLVDTDDRGALVHHPDAFEYEITTPLFSDYSLKYRTVWLPPGATATYSPTGVFDFPVGTAITKTFAWAEDLRRPNEKVHLVETRLLVRGHKGWIAFTYVWDQAGREATIDIAGRVTQFSFVDARGAERTSTYLVPSSAQCGNCHETSRLFTPIGPKARLLNRDHVYQDGTVENQLARWSRLGRLTGAPAPAEAPRLASLDDPSSGTVAERARAWLETNCAHCHQQGGHAQSTGLYLAADVAEPRTYGVCKLPIAAGTATGGRQYAIVPGKPDESILVYRIESTNPGEMMPELGRSLVHAEGVEVVREWITNMTEPPCQ